MQIFEPVSCLIPYIKTFMVVESETATVNRLLPDTTVVAAIRLRGQVQFNDKKGSTSLPAFSISGLRNSYRMAEYGQNSANILVHFKEGGASAFLDLPMHELFESNVELDHLFIPSDLILLQEQIQALESIQSKVNIVQHFFISRLKNKQQDLLIAHAIEKIKTTKGILSIKDLSGHLHISIDVFEKRFRRIVGATPKQFSDIVRMKSLIAQTHFNRRLVDSALDAGFFDQSHFIRNFKKFAGQTPRAFLYAANSQPM